jgi:hypothetical protein
LTPFISEPIKAGQICLKTHTGNSWDSIGKHPIKIRLKVKIIIVGCSYLGNDKIPSPHILNRVILIVYLHYNTVCTKRLLMASMFTPQPPGMIISTALSISVQDCHTFPEFLNPPMNVSFVRITMTLKLSVKADLHCNEGCCLNRGFYGKYFFLNWQNNIRHYKSIYITQVYILLYTKYDINAKLCVFVFPT